MRLPIVLGATGALFITLALSRRRLRPTRTSPKATAAMHREARDLAVEAFRNVVHAEPTWNDIRYLMAVSLHESTFGAAWKGDGEGSNNQGAIHATSTWPGRTFGGIDSTPDAEGNATYYPEAFRAYDTPLEGWEDLVRVLYLQSPATRKAAERDDVHGVAVAMKNARYYEGWGKPDERVRNYEQTLVNALWEIDHFAKQEVQG